MGNTSLKGAYLALLDGENSARISEIASKMTYIELSADNSFYEAFTSALFLPHTECLRPTSSTSDKIDTPDPLQGFAVRERRSIRKRQGLDAR